MPSVTKKGTSTQGQIEPFHHDMNKYCNIPLELKALRQWVCFEVTPAKNEKGIETLGKRPKDPHSGRNAKVNDPNTWGTFDEALAGCLQYEFSHVGFAFTETDSYCGVDVDHCVQEDGELSITVQEILKIFSGTYSEYSTSGTGIHLITRGSFPDSGRKNSKLGIEVYSKGRFFVCTGNILDDIPNLILNQQAALDDFYITHFKKQEPRKQGPQPTSLSMPDNEIIEKARKARNGGKFSALYGGDTSAHADDKSSADFALCSILAFWTRDPDQIDRIFRSSGLYRKKWDRKDYSNSTITKAIDSCSEHYTHPKIKPQSNSTKPNPRQKSEKKMEEPLSTATTEDEIRHHQEVVKESIFKPHSFSELLEMPAKKWLLDHVLGVGDIGMIYGSPGCGKTFAVIDMIICMCLGKLWARRFQVSHQLNVAYCAGEGISGYPSRFDAAARHHGVQKIYNFTFYKIIPQLYIEDENSDTATIKQFVYEWKARQLVKEVVALDVLVIDTLHTASTSADENSAKDMGKVLSLCRWAANELGCAVVLIHHTNKGATAERGSSALRGAMDFMIEIKRFADTGTNAVMSCSKLKDGEQWREQYFDLRVQVESKSVYVAWSELCDQNKSSGLKADDKKTLKAEMERYAGKRFTCKILSQRIAKSENYTRKLLNELESTGECLRELSHPDKPVSSRNCWVYCIESSQTKENSDVSHH